MAKFFKVMTEKESIYLDYFQRRSLSRLVLRFFLQTITTTCKIRYDIHCLKNVRIWSFSVPFRESLRIQSKFRKIRTKKLRIRTLFTQWSLPCVLTCQPALRAYVLTFQRPLCAYVLTRERVILNNVNSNIIQIC